jgi:hypothetical protein
MNPHLIVSIDTEEEGLWGNVYQSHGNTVENIRGVERFQTHCDRFGVRPTYLIDAAVVDDDYSAGLFREIQQDGRCEVGTHLHPWCNPPFEEEVSRGNSYLCNLPETLQREKMVWLTDRIEQRIGRRPTSFRAGRYGMDMTGVRILSELGYVVDSSVIPFTDYSHQRGPDFQQAPHQPYMLDGDDICCPNERGCLLEIPVSVGFNRVNFAWAHAARQLAMRPLSRKLRAVGILDRLGLVRRIKFSPEQSSATLLNTLADVYLAQGAVCMVMMFHSTSLVPGFSPYVPNEDRLERFYDDLAACFEHCQSRGMQAATLTETAQCFLAERVHPAPAETAER